MIETQRLFRNELDNVRLNLYPHYKTPSIVQEK